MNPDELAGVVDLFGALSRGELREAIDELAYKRGVEVEDGAIEAAVATFALVPFDDPERLAVGPTAFPELPEGGEDLPHILDIERRAVDRERVVTAAEERFREEAALAVAAGNEERQEALRDVSYDLEAWGTGSLESLRTRLDAALSLE
ncbi:DUF7109 family protein [Natronomonas sp. EA1]|uniref:DUF7109 family protein n=1 Tax=Natronomonas sp. EA1 TaxID=3421655 RepID=UPI003EBFB68E